MSVFITACRINDAENETIARMLKEKGIVIKYDDHKMSNITLLKWKILLHATMARPGLHTWQLLRLMFTVIM